MAVRLVELGEIVPNFKFRISLEGVVYVFSFRFNYSMNRWILDILDSSENNVLVGIPLLLKTDLIGRFVVSGKPPGKLALVSTDKDENEEATLDTLNKSIFLFYEESV